MTTAKRTCGQCGHWQECHARDGVHGECCADVPFWARGADWSTPPWFVMKNEERAAECDKFTPRELGAEKGGTE